ncbi:2'-5' RNA ligase family protein [Nonomuraea sp. NPDC046570]|uniref:2'-5' RNA ligase family protein n=1 Tax=Nonomuraea sp. NPDC046570 TaxID=3155255 RepID=UPI00340556CD
MLPVLAPDPHSFPVMPPADLDNSRVIVEHEWTAFTEIEQMTSHWDRPGWSDGRRAYYWMLTFAEHRRLSETVEACQRSVACLGMDPVAGPWLHVTMTRIGDTALVAPRDIDKLAKSAPALLPHEFEIAAQPLTGSRGALRLSLAPWTPLIGLHAALTEVGRRAGMPGGKATAGFRPHLAVAYNNRQRPAQLVAEAVSQLRSLAPVTVPVQGVDLVELRREGASYQWKPLHRLALSH